MKIRARKRSRAVILPALLLITLVLVVLAGILVNTGTSSLRVATHEQNANQATYAAEAGLVITVEEYERALELKGERSGDLVNGASYQVAVLKNDEPAARTVHHELLPPEGVRLPAGTMYLIALGRAQDGTTRKAGALFRTGLEAVEVGVLSRSLVSNNSEFHAYDSSAGTDPSVSLRPDSGLLASNRIDSADATPQFDLSDTLVDGAVYVAPNSLPSTAITKSGTTTVTREGVLSEPVVLEDIVIPAFDGDGMASTGGDGQDPEQGGQGGSIGSGSFTVGEMYVGWGGSPAQIEIYEMDFGGLGSRIARLSLTEFQSRISTAESDNRKVLIGKSSGNEEVYWDPAKGELAFYEGGQYKSGDSGPLTGSLKEAVVVGAGEKNKQDPDVLSNGKEYGTVKISDGTPTLLEDGVMVIENLEISAGGKIQLPEGRQSTIYVTGKLSVTGENAILNSTKLPPNLKIYYTGTEPVTLAGGSESYFTLIAPNSEILLRGEQEGVKTNFYGALVGQKVQVENANFFFDLATKGIGTGARGYSLRLLNRHRL